MRKILILSSIYIEDLTAIYVFLQARLDKNKYAVISPMMYIKDNNTSNNKLIQLMGNAVAMSKELDFFALKAKEENKDLLYFGPAVNAAKFDDIIVLNNTILETQEAFLKSSFKNNEMLNMFYSTADKTKEFEVAQDLVDYLNNV